MSTHFSCYDNVTFILLSLFTRRNILLYIMSKKVKNVNYSINIYKENCIFLYLYYKQQWTFWAEIRYVPTNVWLLTALS